MRDEDEELQSAIKLLGDRRGRALLGCEWGMAIWTIEDSTLCKRQARQIVVIHNGEHQVELKLCASHAECAIAATKPHEEHP